jgi:alcohol dehydrogenase
MPEIGFNFLYHRLRKIAYCKGDVFHCENGGWILGNTIDGTQAEYVSPYADTASIPFLSINDEAWVMLSDILPTV